MNLYDKASLILTPNAYKASKLYALKPTDGSGDLTVTRASAAYRRRSDGVLESVANNVPRIHYPVGGACPAFLFESQRTNLKPRSLNWTNSTLALLRTTQTQSAVQPLFNATALQIRETTDNNSHSFQLQPDATLVIGQVYTRSVYLKPTANRQIFNIGDAGQTNSDAIVNVATKTIVGQGTNVSAIRFTDEAGGIVRVEVTFTATATIGRLSILHYISNTIFSYAGDVNEGVDIYHVQYELGTTASSPIITEAATVTRTADTATKGGLTSLIGQTQGTLFLDFIAPASGDTSDLVSLNQSYSNSVCLINVSGGLRAQIYSSQPLIQIMGPTIVANTRYKIALRYNSGASVLTVNGVHYNSASAFTFTGALSSLDFTTGFYSGVRSPTRYNSVMVFPTLLTAAECVALTT